MIDAAVSGLGESVAASGGGEKAAVADEGVIGVAGLLEIVEVEILEVVSFATWASAALGRKPDVEVARGVEGG